MLRNHYVELRTGDLLGLLEIHELPRLVYLRRTIIQHLEELHMTECQPTTTIIDTHRHVWGPKLRQKLVDNGGLDD